MPEILILILIAAMFIMAIKPKKDEEHQEQSMVEEDYIKPQFKPLTQEQVDDIHSRGKITPAEKVREWEDMDLCAPGDAIGSASWRCKKFNYCCHDCLVDYANEQEEYTSMFKIMKEARCVIPIKGINGNDN